MSHDKAHAKLVLQESTPLLSVLIATRNRQRYAAQSITDILSWATSDLELIVEDNSDEDSLRELLGEEINNPILHFRYNSETISSIGNFNATLEQARGIYICLIGDDDGVNSKIIDVVRWAHAHDIDCLVGSVKHEYTWPTLKDESKSKSGLLTYPEFSGVATHMDTSESISKLVKQGGTRYLELPFPRLYHGIVKRSIMEAHKSRTGYYLGGLSPDIYSAILICEAANRVLEIDYPLTIPGVCSISTTATEGKNKTFSNDIYSAPHFRGRPDYVVNPIVPPFYCADTMWAESAIAAITDIGQAEVLGRLNVNALCASIIHSNRRLLKDLMQWRLNQCKNMGMNRAYFVFDLIVQYSKGPLVSVFKRIYRKLTRNFFGTRMHAQQELTTIGSARLFLEETMAARKLDPLQSLQASLDFPSKDRSQVSREMR